MSRKSELVFIPTPGMGHLVSTVEIAKLLVERDDRLSATVIVMQLAFDSNITAYIRSLAASNLSDCITITELPKVDLTPQQTNPKTFFTTFIESHKHHVKDVVENMTRSHSISDSPRLAGFVLDMFCTCMIDVANDFGVPSYIFFTSSAASLGLMFHVQLLHDEHNKNTTELKDSDTELVVPSFVKPVPAKVLPSSLVDNDWVKIWHEIARRFRETKGIMVNTFIELESYAVNSLPSDGKSKQIPPVFPVGPVLDLEGKSGDPETSGESRNKKDKIMTWLDDQPALSVVFLCFGSMGSFGEDQVKEIARALEESGQRFLWSLRRPPPKGKMESPTEYRNLDDVLPNGFLDRTADKGKVIGWAPQVAVLSHPSIGGFVSHCGWNSTLESLSCGVPIATWPMYAEQQLNAFEMVRELRLAVEIKMDYRNDTFPMEDMETVLVSKEEIERGMRCVMAHDSEIRKRVKEMSDLSKKALMKGGSSYSSLGSFIEHVMDNMS